MAAKRDTVAQHGEAQHVAAAEAEEEEATSAEGAETSGSKEPARASGAAKERTHGQRRHMRHTAAKLIGYVIMR